MKKIVIGILLAAMLIVTAAGCSQTTESTSDAETSTAASTETTTTEQASTETTQEATSEAAEEDNDYADTITMVWYPNESASDYDEARERIGELVTEATGKEVEHKLTTDYSIAIESIASGTAQICFMGAEGYIQANTKNDSVQPLVVNSGESGTLEDALYYSWFAVNNGDEADYATADGYSIENIEGKVMSFVSNSSTSGFRIPTSCILTLFGATTEWADITEDDLIEGGDDMFFSEVLFGGSHQGSAVNLLAGNCDVAAFCNTEMAPYMDLVSGEENYTGAVYEVKADASAPFDSYVGQQVFIIKSTPVQNGPFAYNSDTLSPDDVAAIQALLTSEEVANDTGVFIPEGSDGVGMFEKEANECFLVVDDSWYDPIRDLS